MFYKVINHRDIGVTKHLIYESPQEAIDAGFTPVYWKDVRETGEWCRTDDGCVAEVLKFKEYKTVTGTLNYYIRCAFGYVLFNPKYKHKFNAKGRRTTRTYTGENNWLKGKSGKDLEKLAFCVAMYNNYDYAIELVFGAVGKTKHQRLRKEMKTEVFEKMVKKQFKEMAEEHGITEDTVFGLMEKAIQTAEAKPTVNGLMKVIENLQTFYGMVDQTKKTTETLIATETQNMLDGLGEVQQELELKKEVVEKVSSAD